MQLKEVIEILQAEIIWVEDPGVDIHTACGSDMMSDALAFVKDRGMLLTGLLNMQAVRTADMLDMRAVCFVRGKRPGEDIVELAKQRGIALLTTQLRMYTACGRLYSAGLSGDSEAEEPEAKPGAAEI